MEYFYEDAVNQAYESAEKEPQQKSQQGRDVPIHHQVTRHDPRERGDAADGEVEAASREQESFGRRHRRGQCHRVDHDPHVRQVKEAWFEGPYDQDERKVEPDQDEETSFTAGEPLNRLADTVTLIVWPGHAVRRGGPDLIGPDLVNTGLLHLVRSWPRFAWALTHSGLVVPDARELLAELLAGACGETAPVMSRTTSSWSLSLAMTVPTSLPPRMTVILSAKRNTWSRL